MPVPDDGPSASAALGLSLNPPPNNNAATVSQSSTNPQGVSGADDAGPSSSPEASRVASSRSGSKQLSPITTANMPTAADRPRKDGSGHPRSATHHGHGGRHLHHGLVDNNAMMVDSPISITPASPTNHSPSHRIPPPPSPRRHRSGLLKSRANSGSQLMAPSKSWGDLATLGLSMTTADPRERSPGPVRRSMDDRPPLEAELLPPGDAPMEDDSAYDNSARFYYRMHASSRAPSPTRSNTSVSSARSPSPGAANGNAPIYVRRHLTAQSSNQLAVGSTLSNALSPNARFLQQHLPPTFPMSHSHNGSPEQDLDTSPLSPQAVPHSMVILTPTTQEWRELKELSRIEGEPLPATEEIPSGDSDSDLSSSRPNSVSASPDIALQSTDPGAKDRSGTIDPSTSVHPSELSSVVVDPVTQADKPVVPQDTLRVADSALGLSPHHGVLQGDEDDNDDNSSAGSPVKPDGLVRFNSFGRRDSLRLKSRPPMAARAKTKRELERERLFKMVDDEIAEDTSAGDTGKRNSWGVHEIGSGGGLSSPGYSPGLGSPGFGVGTPGAMPDTPPDSPTAPKPPVAATVPDENRHEAPPLLTRVSSSSVPVRPSPLQHEPLTVPIGRTDGAPSPVSADDIELASPESPLNTVSERYEAIRHYSRSFSSRKALGGISTSRGPSRRGSLDGDVSPPRSPRRRDTTRVSLVAGRIIKSMEFPALTPLTSTPASASTTASPTPPPPSAPPSTSSAPHAPLNPPSLSPALRPPVASSLQSFSPFQTGGRATPAFESLRGSISHAPSTGVPSECPTPSSEDGRAVGARGIDDYVILKEAGKGAYGLVMRAKVKGSNGEPVGEEVIIKYIIKSRILADCWKKHRVLGPIPVEIHVMDQVRHLLYHAPKTPHNWDPLRHNPAAQPADGADGTNGVNGAGNGASSGSASLRSTLSDSRPITPRSDSSMSNPPTRRIIAEELKHAPERGHPSICKLLDFFEDREFYYLVMPRFGTGEDLFDHVEAAPQGLPPFEVRSLVGQLADAVRFLHTNGIVHRDIKDENVILDGAGRCQLIDFGSAAHWRPGKRWDTFSGTLHYASPEILRGELYSGKEQDVWALGTVAYVLLVGEVPFAELPDEVFAGLVPGTRAMDALQERCGGRHAEEGKEADGGGALVDAADLVQQCLQQEVGDRPSADALVRHRYLVGGDGWTGFRGWEKKKIVAA